MPSPLPIPPKILAALALVALAGCQPNTPRPVPSVPQIGADLKCGSGDHAYEDPAGGWGFCYPASWKYTVRAQTMQSPDPVELDVTFDITNDPCGKSGCDPTEGLFGYMIVSTYERGGSASLSDWLGENLKSASASEPIAWGNSVEAAKLTDGRRIALTQHHVVIIDLRPGPLDLESAMSSRLGTWKFSV
jgi:hypothetical protein